MAKNCLSGEERLVITHRSCTSAKNSRHRALSFWAVGWALMLRTPAWSPFVVAVMSLIGVVQFFREIGSIGG